MHHFHAPALSQTQVHLQPLPWASVARELQQLRLSATTLLSSNLELATGTADFARAVTRDVSDATVWHALATRDSTTPRNLPPRTLQWAVYQVIKDVWQDLLNESITSREGLVRRSRPCSSP